MRLNLAPRAARLRRLAASLRDCTSGIALTEFAMSLPVLLTLGLFGLETANLAMAHLRISNIAVLTADNAARVREAIDEADVIEIFTGAKMTGDGINFRNNGRIILSSVEPNAAGTGQWIRWQRCDGRKVFTSAYGTQGRGQNDATLQYIGTPTNRISAQPGTAIMVAEVSYNYQPIIPNSFLNNIEIRYESAFNVRQRTDQAIRNAGSTTPRTCNLYNA